MKFIRFNLKKEKKLRRIVFPILWFGRKIDARKNYLQLKLVSHSGSRINCRKRCEGWSYFRLERDRLVVAVENSRNDEKSVGKKEERRAKNRAAREDRRTGRGVEGKRMRNEGNTFKWSIYIAEIPDSIPTGRKTEREYIMELDIDRSTESKERDSSPALEFMKTCVSPRLLVE